MEGLAYLTFDADVKEDLVEDKNALLAMCELAKVGFLTVMFVFVHNFKSFLLFLNPFVFPFSSCSLRTRRCSLPSAPHW